MCKPKDNGRLAPAYRGIVGSYEETWKIDVDKERFQTRCRSALDAGVGASQSVPALY